MKKRSFGRTGLQVSVLGFGGAPVGYLKTEQDAVASILNLLLDNGVSFIDTAISYPGSERMIGQAVGHRRDEFVVLSKCGRKTETDDAKDAPDAPHWSAPLIAYSVDLSLKRLGMDVLDVMLLHSCDYETLKKGEALAALVKARDAGKIRFIGYSGDNETAEYAATLPDITVVETSVSIADQTNIDKVLPLTRKNHVGVIAKRPIANAAWRAPKQQPGMYKDYAQPYHDRLSAMKLSPRELGFAGDDAWAEIALRFTLSHSGVHTAIIGTTNPENAKRNIDYAAKGPLPADVIQKIRDAFRRADPQEHWQGLT
jgi:aryl-alcohol dehydrogenase-like predicted oxidoreductase